MVKITSVHARQVIDSRGTPTIEVDVKVDTDHMGRAIVPSGASTGSREALELRDGKSNYFFGKSVINAIENVNTTIASMLIGKDSTDQDAIDTLMLESDKTINKAHLGANAILGVSMAVAKAAAAATGLPLYAYLSRDNGGTRTLPVPMMNILNGGEHADNTIDFQEFMIMPVGASDVSEAIRMGCEIFHSLRDVLHDGGFSTAVGDEGGFAPCLKSNEEAIQVILKAIENANYVPEKDIRIALDVAASELYRDGRYHLKGEGVSKDAGEMIDMYDKLCKKYPIISIEDGLDESDWTHWEILTRTLGENVQLVGDDLFVTNEAILKEGISKNIANAVLIKLNQIGTVSETLATINTAKNHGYATIISHRSGESEDVFIADLAVATNAGQIKTGSLSRSDRTAKYNQLLRINEELGENAIYLGLNACQR